MASGNCLWALSFGTTPNAFVAALAIILAEVASAEVTFTNSVVIAEGDAAYDGEDIVISGATAQLMASTLSVPCSSLTLAVLTHSACTALNTHRLEIEVAGTVTVDATSRIDVTGKGYVAGRTGPNNTTVGAASGASGGSYGGLGGNHSGSANAVYGDYADPNDWGSGSSAGQGNAGGGLVRVTAGSLQLEGVLLANGSGSSSGCGVGGWGLCGGEHAEREREHSGQRGKQHVWLWRWWRRAGSGVCWRLERVQRGGHHGAWGNGDCGGSRHGVSKAQRRYAVGTLVIDNSLSGGAAWTPLGVPGTNDMVIPDVVVIRGSKTMVSAEHSGLVLHFSKSGDRDQRCVCEHAWEQFGFAGGAGNQRRRAGGSEWGVFCECAAGFGQRGAGESGRGGNLVSAGDRFGHAR